MANVTYTRTTAQITLYAQDGWQYINFDAISPAAGEAFVRWKAENTSGSAQVELRDTSFTPRSWGSWYTDKSMINCGSSWTLPRIQTRFNTSSGRGTINTTFTLTVEFEQTAQAITVNAGTGGTASASKSSAAAGETITITCSPSTGYTANTPTASGITFTAAGANKWTFTMPSSAVTVSCTFSKISYNVTANAGTGGSASRDKATATMGETVTITCTPSAGYKANTPTASGITFTSAGTNKWSFTMPAAAVTVSCTFSKVDYNVTVSAGTGGTASSNKTTAQIGDTVTITCSPSTGYSANTPTASGISFTSAGTNKWSFTMPAAAVTISCTFSKISYSISKAASPAAGGTVTVGATSATMGTEVTVSQTPADGYYFNGWTISPSSVTISGGKFTMPAGNVSITANYLKRSTATLSSASMTGGGTVTLTISPDKASYSHKYNLSFGTGMATGLVNVAAGTNTVTISVPLNWSAQIPSATSKTGGTLTLETYNGSTKIGTYTISSLTYNVPASVVPSIGTITTSVVRTIGGTTYANVGNYYVQNKSGVRIQCSASGAQSSSISSLEVTMSGYTAAAYKKTVSAASVDFTSGLLTNSGSCTITVKATDSRGRTATKTASITVQAYNRPSGSLRVWRVDNAGNTDPLGTYAKYEKSSSYTAIGSNSLTVTLTGGGGSATNPADTGNILPNSRITFSQTSEYTISLTLADAFETVTIQVTLPTAQFMIFVNANGDRIGFMKATNESLSKNGKDGTIELSGNHQVYIGNTQLEKYIAVLALNCGTISSLPETITNQAIESDMVVLQSELGTPAAQRSDWTVNTSNGSLTISGTISGSTTVKLYLMKTK